MKHNEFLLARLYAAAFLNVYGSQLTKSDIVVIKQLAGVLEKYRFYFSLLSIAAYSFEEKVQMLTLLLIKKAQLPSLFTSLINLLMRHNRSVLLPIILSSIVKQYRKQHAICSFNITSSHQLEPTELTGIKQFLAAKTGCDIIYTYGVDSTLIAGIRLQSDVYLWEYSVRKSLNAMKVAFIHQERYG